MAYTIKIVHEQLGAASCLHGRFHKDCTANYAQSWEQIVFYQLEIISGYKIGTTPDVNYTESDNDMKDEMQSGYMVISRNNVDINLYFLFGTHAYSNISSWLIYSAVNSTFVCS